MSTSYTPVIGSVAGEGPGGSKLPSLICHWQLPNVCVDQPSKVPVSNPPFVTSSSQVEVVGAELLLQRYSGSCLAVMLANLKSMDIQMADYWALHLQMEFQMGSINKGGSLGLSSVKMMLRECR